MKKLIAVSVLSSLFFHAEAATLSKISDQLYGAIEEDQLICSNPTSDGGFILAGASFTKKGKGNKSFPGYGGDDVWIVKIDTDLKIQWQKIYGGTDFEGNSWGGKGVYIEQTLDGGYILGATSWSGANGNLGGQKSTPNKGKSDYWVLKLDANGNKKWEQTFGGSGEDELSCVRQVADGGYLVGGTSSSPADEDKTYPPIGSRDFWVLKLKENGNKEWDCVYGGTDDDSLQDIVLVDSNKNAILGGVSNSLQESGTKTAPNYGDYDYWIVKIDAINDPNAIQMYQFWDQSFGGDANDLLHGMTLYKTYLLLTGDSQSNISGDKSEDNRDPSQDTPDMWIVKSDLNGKFIWDKTIGVEWGDGAWDAKVTNEGNILVGGWSNSFNWGPGTDKSQPHIGPFDGSDMWIVKLNASGQKIWDESRGTVGVDTCRSLWRRGDALYLMGNTNDQNGSIVPNFDKSQQGWGFTEYWVSSWKGIAPNALD